MDSEPDTHKDGSDFWTKKMPVVIGVIFLLWIVGAFNQIKKPGSFFEKANYSGKFYVLVFPGGDTVKNYKVPGDIDKREDDCDPGDGSCSSNYYLSTIYWPNGGSTSFDDCAITNEKSYCTSEDDREYYIELTSESAQ